MLSRSRFIAAILSLVAGFSFARGAEFPVPRGPAGEPNPFVFEWEAANRAAPAYAGHEAWYPLWKETHELLPDGTVSATVHSIAIANHRHALDVIGDSILWFDPSCEQAVLNEARLHKKSGEIVDIEPSGVHVRDDNTDSFVFVPDKVLVVSMAEVEVGDAIEVKFTRQIDDPQTHGELCGRFVFSAPDYPIHKSELAVRLPKGRELTQLTYGIDAAPSISEEAATRTWIWTASGVAPVEQPRNAPHDYVAEAGVDFTTYPSWSAVADLIHTLRDDRSEFTPAMATELARVTAGCESPLEKTRALAVWVRDAFRYLSIDHGAFGFRPHPPELVLKKRFGDCKDLCHLLQLMLREAGIASEMVFLNVEGESPLRHEVPSPLASHVVLLVKLEDQEHWIDPTSPTTAWNRLRTDLFGRPALAVSESGWRKLKTPERAAELHSLRVEREAKVALGGAVSWRVKQTWRDYAADDRRGELVELPANHRRRALFDEYSIYHSEAKQRDPSTPLPLGEADEPLTAEIAFDKPAPVGDVDSVLWPLVQARPGEEIVSDDPEAIGFFSPPLLSQTAMGFEVDRAAPWRIDGLSVDDDLRVRLGPGVTPLVVTAGEKVVSRFGAASLATSLDEDRGEIVFRWRLTCSPQTVAPEQFAEYLKFLEALDDLAMVELQYATVGELLPEERGEISSELAESNYDPRNTAAIVEALLRSGENVLARSLLESGLEHSANDPVLLALRVRLADESEQRLAALASLKAIKDHAWLAALCRARELYLQKKHAESLAEATKLLAGSGGDDRAFAGLWIARNERALHRPEAALAVIKKYREESDVAAPEFDLLAAEIHYARKDWKRALIACEKARLTGFEDERTLRLGLEAALAAKDHPTAARYLREYTVIAADDPSLWLVAARLCYKADRIDDACDFAEMALDVEDPRQAQEAKALLAKLKGEKPPARKTPAGIK